ncbi:MAG: DUF6151 family protein [Pseudomonadota bacterium]
MAKALKNIALSCTCGSLQGVLKDVSPRTGTHLICHCDDCRAANNHIGKSDPGDEGIDLFQTTPDKIEIVKGGGNLGIMRLGPRGLMRWYATCCNTPMFNTLASAKLPFVGVQAASLEAPDELPRVTSRMHKKGKDGKPKHQGAGRAGFKIVQRMAAARISGRWKDTPFFDATTLDPVVEPQVLTRKERADAHNW